MHKEDDIHRWLFDSPFHSFHVSGGDEMNPDDTSTWRLIPLEGKTLAREYMEGPFEGRFIIEGQVITGAEERAPQQCYLELVLPERICEYRYILVNGSIARLRGRRGDKSTAIPAIGIERFGVPQLYYATENPNAGIRVLEEALRFARQKKYIAYDLAVLLRQQKRHSEAIRAFTTLLAEEGEHSDIARTAYKERSLLYTAVGEHELAAKDKQSWSAAFEKANGRPPSVQEQF